MKILLLIASLTLIALALAVLKRTFFPPRYKFDEPDFDLRAQKIPDDLAKDAARYAMVKTLAKQRYTLKASKPDSTAKAIRNFFRR